MWFNFCFFRKISRDKEMQENAGRFFHQDFSFRYLKKLQIAIWLQKDWEESLGICVVEFFSWMRRKWLITNLVGIYGNRFIIFKL